MYNQVVLSCCISATGVGQGLRFRLGLGVTDRLGLGLRVRLGVGLGLDIIFADIAKFGFTWKTDQRVLVSLWTFYNSIELSGNKFIFPEGIFEIN